MPKAENGFFFSTLETAANSKAELGSGAARGTRLHNSIEMNAKARKLGADSTAAAAAAAATQTNDNTSDM